MCLHKGLTKPQVSSAHPTRANIGNRSIKSPEASLSSTANAITWCYVGVGAAPRAGLSSTHHPEGPAWSSTQHCCSRTFLRLCFWDLQYHRVKKKSYYNWNSGEAGAQYPNFQQHFCPKIRGQKKKPLRIILVYKINPWRAAAEHKALTYFK